MAMLPSSADIKRDIIEAAGKSSAIRKRVDKMVEAGISEGDQIEMGNSLETMTKTPGWAIIEQYMLVRMNLVGMAMSETVSEIQRGQAKAFVELMQYIQLIIKQKNTLMEKERLRHEAEDVPQDESD
jgi:hypothetical protein